MTTFTSEDLQAAKLVEEAPYHPGYEDAVIDDKQKTWMEEYNEYKNRHLNTSKKIVEYIKVRNFGRC
jgi:hypothetical protein